MKVILLENLKRIGSIGEVIDVKRGFARNFLIANKKALYASKENINEVGKKVWKSYYNLILVRDKKLYGNNNMDKLFRNEIDLYMKKNNSNKILFSEFMNKFDNNSLFSLLYNFRGCWRVNSYNDRFENWVRRSKLLVKEKININNRLWIVK